jgi:hypothetical protein
MSLINYSDVTGAILDGKDKDTINLHNGYYLREAVGYAKITSTPQTSIPIYLPSQAQAGGELVTNPDRLLVLPAGAIINRIALRLPKLESDKAAQYGNLPAKSTLIGTTGELVKVGAAGVYTTTDPAIAAVAGAYVPNSSKAVNRGIATSADVAASGLVTLGAATQYNLLVSNAGSTAAGTGISTNAGDTFAIVQIAWYEIQPAPTYEMLGYQSKQKGI